jgi:diaminohydroxyphosphoribosylaminopyrimidine deaminase/5-amino-6-(5-phosphoribosylamino)uracil reductase
MNAPAHAPVAQPAQRPEDAGFMAEAIALGVAGLGLAAPNPSVGAVVVKDGVIIGRGATRPGGRPHAETEALRDAGDAARGATLYVSLEPCSHHGVTPPCADAIVKAGVARVVSALDDPDKRVSGRGHNRLRDAGVEVLVGVGAREARRANLGHIRRIVDGRPMVTLKLAETADGYAAGSTHDQRLMITGLDANNRVQKMRAQHDAIMVGIGTALADDPLLTVRSSGLEHHRPLRVVLDTHLRLRKRSRIAATAHERKTLILCGNDAPAERQILLESVGIDIVRLPLDEDGHVDLREALHVLAKRGVTRVFSEGGPTIARRLVDLGLADEVVVFTSPKPLGREGVRSLDETTRKTLRDTASFDVIEDGHVGVDRMRIYERRA